MIYEEFAKKFFELAKRDYERAKKMFESKDYPACVFFCQQSTEKAVKSMLEIRKKIVFNHGPFLISIFEEAFKDEWSDKYKIIIEALDFLQSFYTMSRYPKLVGNKVLDPYEIIDENIAKKALEYSEKVLKIAEEYLKKNEVI